MFILRITISLQRQCGNLLKLIVTLSCVQDHPLRVEQPHTSLSLVLVHLTLYTYNNELLINGYIRKIELCMAVYGSSNVLKRG